MHSLVLKTGMHTFQKLHFVCPFAVCSVAFRAAGIKLTFSGCAVPIIQQLRISFLGCHITY